MTIADELEAWCRERGVKIDSCGCCAGAALLTTDGETIEEGFENRFKEPAPSRLRKLPNGWYRAGTTYYDAQHRKYSYDQVPWVEPK